MRYTLRLAQLVGHKSDRRKRPGTIKSIVEATGMDRHQVAALLRNEVKYIPLKALSQICDYLVLHGLATAEELPGALFAIEPENFWELLARRHLLEICIGVRGEVSDDLHGAWLTASDSVLFGELLNGVSTLGGTTMLNRSARQEPASDPSTNDSAAAGDAGEEAPVAEEAPGGQPSSPARLHPHSLKQSLVWSPGHEPEDMIGRAREVYDAFDDWRGDKALVCLGSIKSNPVVELMLAEAFAASPFESQDGVSAPSDRRCPFILRYRDNDPHFTSCGGGAQLANGKPGEGPGIYYETKDGRWLRAAWDEKSHDAAIVFYIWFEPQGRLEMVLGGFSGRATRLLSRTLTSHGQELWPPQYEGQGIRVGAFIIEYKVSSKMDRRSMLRTDLAAETNIIPLDQEVIAARMATY